MKAPNHIAGGIVFTGIFYSLWNVNIFSSPWYISLTVFSSLLPDIDHSRSIIGKMFLPIARYLDKNFGHRTITHSLLFLVGSYLIVYLFSAFTISDMNIPMIFIFAFSSHLIFDMLTVQGVPLFYPFKRNPCVIPGNPDHRLNSKLGTETIIFAIFLVMMYFCMPLFENGFWLSYNKNYNSLKHLHSSASKFDKLLQVEYDFADNSNWQKGQGLLLFSKSTEAVLYDDGEIIEISSNAKIKTLQPEVTDKKKVYQNIAFRNITADSLNQILDNVIVAATISSELPFNIISNNQISTKKSITMEWINQTQISTPPNQEIENLKLKELELKHEEKLYQLDKQYFNSLQNQKKEISSRLKQDISDYTRELLVNHLREIEDEILGYNLDNSKINKLKAEIDLLREKANQKQQFTGEAKILKILSK